jgi:hypothetical protein
MPRFSDLVPLKTHVGVRHERMTIEHITRALDQVAVEFGNQPQNVGEQIPWDGDLGHHKSRPAPKDGESDRDHAIAAQAFAAKPNRNLALASFLIVPPFKAVTAVARCAAVMGTGSNASHAAQLLIAVGVFKTAKMAGIVNGGQSCRGQRHRQVCQMWAEGDQVLKLLFNPVTDQPKPWLRGIVQIERDTIILPNGIPLRFKLERNITERSFMRIDGRKKTKRKSNVWGGALTGEIVQALARVYLSATLIRIKEATGLMPLCLRHDEAVYSVPEGEVEDTTGTYCASGAHRAFSYDRALRGGLSAGTSCHAVDRYRQASAPCDAQL